MFKKSVLWGLLAMTFFGCASINYYGDRNYVGFSSDEELKSSKQKSALLGDNQTLQNTYDDEFFYDSEGRLVKHVQTEHIQSTGAKPIFIEWQIQYAVIAGHSVPKSVAANGIVYLEVEYALLPTKGSGMIAPHTVNPKFFSLIKIMLEKLLVTWELGLDTFPIPFKSDGKFVTTKQEFSAYSGLSQDNYLSLGYDNIALKRFFFSREKLAKGLGLSWQQSSVNPTNLSQKNNWEFLMDWDVKAEKIIQTKMTVNRNYLKDYMIFEAVRKFDDAGRRVEEVWTATDHTRTKLQPVLLFEQKLAY